MGLKKVNIAVEHKIHRLSKMIQTTSKDYTVYVITVKTTYYIYHRTMHGLSYGLVLTVKTSYITNYRTTKGLS